MPPKTEAALSPSEIVEAERLTNPRTYSDYPSCLPRYRWIIVDAQKSPERLFNQVSPLFTCKVCGLPEPQRSNWPAHAKRHLEELDGKRKPPPAPEPAERMNRGVASALFGDIFAIVSDSIKDKADGVEIDGDAVTDIASMLDNVAAETTDIGEAPLCADCSD